MREGEQVMSGPVIKPPFTKETALAKVKAAENAWNTRDPERVALAYTDDAENNWFRSHGNEHWEFDHEGLMLRRDASINDIPIQESERRYFE
jgi:nuclear transport factor 2 (NTF2) superfamily protein